MKIKKLMTHVFTRLFLFGLALVVQIAWLIYTAYAFSDTYKIVNVLLTFLSLLAVVYIINGRSNPAVKLAWIVPILEFPIIGGVLFLISGGKAPKRKLARAMNRERTHCLSYSPDCTQTLHRLNDDILEGQCRYLERQGYPIYANTKTEYFPLGEEGFAALIEDLKSAEHFIFMEYFIIHPGRMWDTILDILLEKAAAGVDVRLIYDDVGSVSTLPFRYAKKLEQQGIKAVAFNPFIPIYSTVMNNRDHRKITVIDGNIAYTGGTNFADEYINVIERFGHWKDNMVRLEGEGVWGMTLLFLEMWNTLRHSDKNLDSFRPTKAVEAEGFVIPYGDTPLDDEYLGESVYLNMINCAKRYVYIMTPYLIIDQDMQTALTLAAKRGVDVRIMTPGIPDKKMVFDLTRSHYPALLHAGVKIYEYTPGFVHSKICVVDDEIAVVGTINMDYRSLTLHFENACLFLKNKAVDQAKEDFLRTQTRCTRVYPVDMEKKQSGLSLLHGIYYAMLRLFAPLL